jgi:hypothetical protein
LAARRLLILMLAVLGVSTLAAALLAPPPEREQTETTTEESPPTGSSSKGGGRLIEAQASVSTRRPEKFELRPGDQLSLTVRSRAGGQVEIPAFGLIEDVGPSDPARFDLLAERPGEFEVRLVDRKRVLGRIVVREPNRDRGSRSAAD